MSLAVFVALKGGFMPPILKYITTTIDLALVTTLAWLGQVDLKMSLRLH